jgi:mannitol/fructose-specific phosphotransferase system IIA component (Ntr-type)
MLFSELLAPGSIVLPLKSTVKKDIIRELLSVVRYDRSRLPEEEVYKAVLQRENVTSTGIGEGVAVPHAKCDIREDLVMAMGVSPEPLEFYSLDKKPVRLFFLLLSRKDVAGPHLQMLAKIAKFIRNDKVRQELLACSSPEAAYEIIKQEESQNLQQASTPAAPGQQAH